MTTNAFDRIANKLATMVETKTQDIVERRANSIQKSLVKLQRNFYTTLTKMVVDSEGPPSLGAFTPTWQELSDSYTSRPDKEGKGFYKHTGGLQRSLLQSKATTTFGTPLAYVTSGGNIGRSKAKRGYLIGSRVRVNTGGISSLAKLTHRKLSMVIDLYPKVVESILDGNIDEGDYFSDKIAIKMTNFRGQRLRPILVEYMNWWLETKAKRIVRNGK